MNLSSIIRSSPAESRVMIEVILVLVIPEDSAIRVAGADVLREDFLESTVILI